MTLRYSKKDGFQIYLYLSSCLSIVLPVLEFNGDGAQKKGLESLLYD